MELRTYLAVLNRRKWIIILTTLVIAAAVTIATLLATPQYQSSAMLRVATVGGSSQQIGYTERLMNTYVQIVKSNRSRSELKERLGVSELPKISVDLIPNTELMTIRAEGPDSELARDAANAAADILVVRSQELYVGSGQTTQEILAGQLTQVQQELNDARAEYEALVTELPNDEEALNVASQSIALKERTYATLLDQYETARVNEALRVNGVTVVEPAVAPSLPSSPRKAINIILGIVVGLMTGIVLAFLFENLDTTLYTTEQIEAASQMTTVGRIPEAKDNLQIARLSNGQYPQLEAFRRLRTNILALEDSSDPQTVLLTSAQRSEGKSTVAANLAVTIAQSGRRVIVVDCDMRLPTVHKVFDLPNKRGLTSVLTNEVELDEALLHTTFPRVQALTSGPLPPNPTELLGSPQMAELLKQLKDRCDYVLLDTPALLSVADAAVLAPQTDSVLVVVAQAQTHREDIQMVRKQLSNVKVKSIGIVVNRAEMSENFVSYGQPENA